MGKHVPHKVTGIAKTTGLVVIFALSACATPTDDPHPPITHSERMSLQNECVRIADNSERQRCLDQAAFAEKH